tara:strand:+ start:221 stop:862 length:642 start_codon:yes stop_codon:yes gene_type:complete
MPIQIEKTISTDARNTLVRNRDAIQAKHNVKIFFPKNLVRGAYQDMIIKGGVTATTNAERDIDRILFTWKQEFDAFKDRQARRKARRNQIVQAPPQFPTIQETSAKTSTNHKSSSNPFAVLEDFEPLHQDTTSNTKPTSKSTSKLPVLKGWASVAAKPPVKQEPPKPVIPVHNTTLSWAEIAEQEDEYDDDDDWPITDDAWGTSTSVTSWAEM